MKERSSSCFFNAAILYTAEGDVRGQSHEVIVEEPLPLGEAATHDMLKLLGHLLLDVHLDPPEQERSQHLMESLDQALVVLLAALDHPRQRVGEPFFELAVGLEHVRHEEVHQGPQLHEAVLQGGSSQQEAPVAATHTRYLQFLIFTEMFYL